MLLDDVRVPITIDVSAIAWIVPVIVIPAKAGI